MTDVALRLLDKSPDRVEVLKQFVQQFNPRMWNGSRAAVVESNARVLDELQAYPDPAVVEFVVKEKIRFGQLVESERLSETLNDSKRDERFE